MISESLMLPEPEAVKPLVPPEPVAVHESETMAGLRAKASVRAAPLAIEGPEFETTTV
jgi:hypothetical protein